MEINRSNNMIGSLLADKRRLILFGVGLLLLLLFLLFVNSVFSPKDQPLPPGGVDQQFNYDQGAKVSIDPDLTAKIDISEDRYYVYDIQHLNHSDVVQQFMIKIGKAFWTKQQFDEIYYIWQKSSSDTLQLVDYDAIQDKAFFRFDQPVELDLIHNGGVLSTDMLDNFFRDFIKEYFGSTADFSEARISRTGQTYRIEVNRNIDGIQVQNPGFNEYTDYIVIEQDGALIEGQVYLFELGERTEVSLIDPNLLGSVINRADYPKDINELAPIGLDLTSIGSEPYDPASGFLGDAPPQSDIDKMPTPDSCKVRTIDVVYYYIRATTKNLAPAFRMDCRGTITYEGEQYVVPLIIYANALDPELVYVPGNLTTE